MAHFAWKFFLVIFLLSFCKNSQEFDNHLIVNIEKTSLREEPTEKSREIAVLKKGQSLTDLGKVSQTESQILLEGQLSQSPWVMVQTKQKQNGWAHAGALKPSENKDNWMMQKRLDCYFGKNLTARQNVLLQELANPESDVQHGRLWRESKVLRDTFMSLISSRPKTEMQLDFAWLQYVLPGYILQKVGANNQFYIFANIDYWHKKSLTTNGSQDDNFFKTLLTAFPVDNVESFYPVWEFQISESSSASQLGLGHHANMLSVIDDAIKSETVFAPELVQLKHLILEDIFDKKQRYWQSKDRILAELEHILNAPPNCLTAREIEALGIRKRMFDAPEKNGILLNLRSGE
ncbi:MAG: hypothetical protein ACKVT2_21850 [Saprospiraceae bacterium]